MKWVEKNITAQQFAAITSEVQKRTGIAVAGNDGEMEVRGFRVHFTYDEATQVLELDLKDKPWYVPESLVEAKFKEFLAGPGAEFLRS